MTAKFATKVQYQLLSNSEQYPSAGWLPDQSPSSNNRAGVMVSGLVETPFGFAMGRLDGLGLGGSLLHEFL